VNLENASKLNIMTIIFFEELWETIRCGSAGRPLIIFAKVGCWRKRQRILNDTTARDIPFLAASPSVLLPRLSS
jgi:hypothetical protein